MFHIHSVHVHFGNFYIASAVHCRTTQRRSRLQHGYCIGVSRRSAQAIVSKGLAQGPYVAARAGVELTTLRLKVINSYNAPLRPTMLRCFRFIVLCLLLCINFDAIK